MAARFQMQAVSGGVGGDGDLYSWTASAPDWEGTGFPGPGDPLEIAVSEASREEESGGQGPTGSPGTPAPGGTGPTGAPGANAAPPFARHDTTHGPVILLQFDGTVTDSSGNSRDMVIASGNAGKIRYTDIYPGFKGHRFDGGTRLSRTAPDAALAITGDLTVEMILSLDSPTAGGVLFNFDGFSFDESGNSLYAIVIDSSGLSVWWEHGANNQDNWFPSPPLFLPPGANHLALTRASNVLQFYLNGRAWGAPSSTQTAPTGGTVSALFLGNSNDSAGFFPPGALSSFKIVNSALSAAQIKAEYNRTLGQVYGQLP